MCIYSLSARKYSATVFAKDTKEGSGEEGKARTLPPANTRSVVMQGSESLARPRDVTAGGADGELMKIYTYSSFNEVGGLEENLDSDTASGTANSKLRQR